MDIEKAKGFQDQELLLQACVSYASKKISRSENVIKGILRQSITEWVESNKISLKELKDLDEQERIKNVVLILDIFVDKVSHLIQSNLKQKQFKEDILKIYKHWKITRRT